MSQTVITRVSVVAAAVLGVCAIGSVILACSTSSAADAAVTQQSESLTAAAAVQDSSKFLPNTIHAYTATCDSTWLDAYWKEVNVDQTQLKALDKLKALGTPDAEIALVNEAHAKSYDLINRETRAMRLVLDAEKAPPT
ncbi:MAG: hypothetical protein ABI382_05960 [Nakamurella sp.]